MTPQWTAPPLPETLRLANGYLASIDGITPAQRPVLEAAMLRLSPESSRRRFFTPRFRLSERELVFLTESGRAEFSAARSPACSQTA